MRQSSKISPYRNCVQSSLQDRGIDVIEKVQKRATKLVIQLKKRPYTERLKELDLHTLKYRGIRGDMIAVFKIIHQKYDVCAATQRCSSVTE